MTSKFICISLRRDMAELQEWLLENALVHLCLHKAQILWYYIQGFSPGRFNPMSQHLPSYRQACCLPPCDAGGTYSMGQTQLLGINPARAALSAPGKDGRVLG